MHATLNELRRNVRELPSEISVNSTPSLMHLAIFSLLNFQLTSPMFFLVHMKFLCVQLLCWFFVFSEADRMADRNWGTRKIIMAVFCYHAHRPAFEASFEAKNLNWLQPFHLFSVFLSFFFVENSCSVSFAPFLITPCTHGTECKHPPAPCVHPASSNLSLKWMARHSSCETRFYCASEKKFIFFPRTRFIPFFCGLAWLKAFDF